MKLVILILGAFLLNVLRSIRKNTNSLKFTFLWIIFLLLASIPLFIPRVTSNLLSDFGFQNPADGLLALSIIYISSILFYATTTITRQARKIEELAIQLALRTAKSDDRN
jgi:hypothetical protein